MTNRIYVACLASYNNGELHGKWIDASSDVDTMQAEVDAILRASKYPNVEVDCPDCGNMVQSSGCKCETCKDAGRVPSAEEFAIHDFEGAALQGLKEYCGLQAVADRVELEEIAENELGDDGLEIVLAYWDNQGLAYMPKDAHDAVEQAREAYLGAFDSWEKFADDYCENTGFFEGWPETAITYFDHEAFARDMRCGGDVFENDGHYFYSH